MTKKIIISILLGSALALAAALASFPKSSKVTEKEVVKPVLTSTVAPASPLSSKKNKIYTINVEPEQVILLNTEVADESVEFAISRLKELNDLELEAYVVLDSPGGSVFAGERLISFMEGSKIKVSTVCFGLCASMAAHIHQHGATRYMFDRSILMFHQAAGGAQGSMKEMTNFMNFLERTMTKLDAYVANRSGISRDKFDHMVEHELWVDAEDSLDLNLTDKLILLNVREGTDLSKMMNINQELIKNNIKIKSIIPTTNNPLKDIH